MKTPTPFRKKSSSYHYTAYTGSRRRIQIVRVQPMGLAYAAPAPSRIPTILSVLMLALFASLTIGYLSHPAYAVDMNTPAVGMNALAIDTNTPTSDTDVENPARTISETPATAAKISADPEPTAPKTLLATLSDTTAVAKNVTKTPDIAPTASTSATDTATRIYISCPIEIYRGTLYDNQPAEYLVDDFEDIPEHWLYVLSPLEEGENYIFTLDLSCRAESAANSPFQGEISAVYSSYIPDDGSLGSVRIEATEQIAPDTFLVYYGEIKYISDCSSLISESDNPDDSAALYLTQNSYANLYDHHLFYFSLTTPDFPENTQPLGEQRLSRLVDPAISATVTITGDAECHSNVYDEDLLQSDYMYPYRRYDPAESSRPNSPDNLLLLANNATQSDLARPTAA